MSYTGMDAYCGVIPNDWPSTDVFQGGTATGNLCWSVDESKASTLQMYADTGFGKPPVFFALS